MAADAGKWVIGLARRLVFLILLSGAGCALVSVPEMQWQ
jgi:hypothetical protein